MSQRYQQFGLVLMVNHACNLRCTYCYTGDKFSRAMPIEVGTAAIDRAVASLEKGGDLELGFFGGEPLLEAELIEELASHARGRAKRYGVGLKLGLTTNGTLSTPAAWRVMGLPGLELAVSFDGRPGEHDRHRLTVQGRSSSGEVLATIRKLIAAGQPPTVICVVRPDTVDQLAEGLIFLRELGIARVEPSLDLWTTWSAADISRLVQAVGRCAQIWREGLPDFSVSWFDEKATHLAGMEMGPSARCGFGAGEVAIAPSGNLYPCERLIGEDARDQAMRLPGHALDGALDFLSLTGAAARSHDACNSCVLAGMCSSVCRCSNYVRTGDVRWPDGLLCAWNQACIDETARMMTPVMQGPNDEKGRGRI